MGQTDETMEHLGLRMPIEANRLEKWVRAGLGKLYPGVPVERLLAGLNAAFENAKGNQHEEDQIWAELVHKVRQVGHTPDSL